VQQQQPGQRQGPSGVPPEDQQQAPLGDAPEDLQQPSPVPSQKTIREERQTIPK
jgi:hypothetical protein